MMLLQAYMRLCLSLRGYLRSLSPCVSRAAQAGILSLNVLLLTYLLSLTGLYDAAEHKLLEILGGHPFYMTAMEAQIDFVKPHTRALLCGVMVLYLTFVLLGESCAMKRAAILVLSLVALIFASFSAIFWGGVLNIFALIAALIFLALGLCLRRLTLRHLASLPELKS